MDNFIVIREYKTSDVPSINQVIRNAYLSNVYWAWFSTLTKEITFQMIVAFAAIMFIFMGVPLQYCLLAIPLVMIILLLAVFCAFLMKAMELMYGKQPLQCWVAESFEPYFSVHEPKTQSYRIIQAQTVLEESLDLSKYHKQIVGTISVSKLINSENSLWLFRLGVNNRYTQKGIACALVKSVQQWCRQNRYHTLMLAVSEYQDNARKLFMNTGFVIKQMYHKQIIGSAISLLMYQLECIISPIF